MKRTIEMMVSVTAEVDADSDEAAAALLTTRIAQALPNAEIDVDDWWLVK